MKTYFNKNGRPIIRSCKNCVLFKPLPNDPQTGYCLAERIMFAYTMEETVYKLTKSFCLCNTHKFHNEEALSNNAATIDQRDILKNKDEVEH